MWMRSPRCAKTSLRTTVRQSPHSAETIVLLCTMWRLCLQSSTIIISLFYSYQTIILNFIFNNLLFWVYLVLCVMNFRNGSAQSCEIYTKSKQSRNSWGRKLYAQAWELRKIRWLEPQTRELKFQHYRDQRKQRLFLHNFFIVLFMFL